MRKAIYFCAMVGGLIGFGEAACIQRLSKLYLTLNGRVGITLVAALIYAVYGGLACALLFPLWRRFWRGKQECAILSSAVNAWCLLYGFAYFMICRLMRIEEFRFLLWGVCLLILSVILSFITGWAFGWLLKGRRHIYVGIAAFIAIMFLMFFPGRRQATPEKELPNVVMVTLDTTRADRIHSYGNDRIRTPTLDRIASEGILFENAISQIPITNPSHLSILSSKYPHQHGIIENWYRHSRNIPKFVYQLRENGYQIAAFLSSFTLDSRFGFSHGFDIYDDDFSRLKGYQSLTLSRVIDTFLRITGARRERIAERTNAEAISWLERCARSPFFLWVHYFDPHGPYEPPPPYSGMYYQERKDDPHNRSMDGIQMPIYWPPSTLDFTDITYPVAQYDAEVTYMDAELGRLLEKIDSHFKDTILIVVGDHGESLTEHGYYFRHGDQLYEEDIKVPMIIRPGMDIGPGRVGSVVETVDIAPTILELVELDVPSWCSGESLVPIMKGEGTGSGEGLSETRQERDKSIIDVAYFDGRYKLIVRPGKGTQLFDLNQDPGELHDISGEREDLVRELREKVASMMTGPTGEGEPLLDYETQEMLRSLGYIR